MKHDNNFHKDYWEKNIEGFSGFYDKKSEENLSGSLVVSFFYMKFIFPLEKKYMIQRHIVVTDFIEKNVRENMKTADIGCGSGVYTKKMIQMGAEVFASDYAESAVVLTNRNLTSEEKKKSHIDVVDILKKHIPQVNVAISIGVLPYIDNLSSYLNNILPYADHVLFNYLEKDHPINSMRRKLFKFLDVRKYSYHRFSDVIKELALHDFVLVKKTALATGFIIEAKRR